MYAQFNRFEFIMTKAQGESASHQGECYDDVVALLKVPAIKRQLQKIDPEDIKAELKEYGAWDAEELQDEEKNHQRIVWIAACDITENAKGVKK